MLRKIYLGIMAVSATLFVLAGCATSRPYASDTDAMNSKVSALQAQVASKDEEIARLQGQLSQQQTALSQTESEKKALADRLEAALAKPQPTATQEIDSDLK